MRLFLILVISGGCFTELAAQSFRTSIETLRKKYESVENLHMVLELSVFEDTASGQPVYTDKIDMKRNGSFFKYVMGTQEMLLNEKYLIVVNKTSKEIMFSPRDQKSETLMENQFQISLDSIFNVLGDPVFIETTGDVDHYTLARKEGMISKIDFYLNRRKGLMEKLAYQYREGQKVTIRFEAFNTEPRFTEDTFSEKFFFIISNGKVKASPAFSNYVILNTAND